MKPFHFCDSQVLAARKRIMKGIYRGHQMDFLIMNELAVFIYNKLEWLLQGAENKMGYFLIGCFPGALKKIPFVKNAA